MVQVRKGPSGPFEEVGGGGGVENLSALRWVDPQTEVPVEQQTGSIATPFARLQAAIDSLAGIAAAGVICCPGDYGAESVTWNDGGAERLVLYGFGAVGNIGSITSTLDARLELSGLGTADLPVGVVTLFDTSLKVTDCQIGSVDANASAVTSVRSAIGSGAQSVLQSLDAVDADFLGVVSILGATVARDTRFRAAVNAALVTARDCSFEDQFTAQLGSLIEAYDCFFSFINDGIWEAKSCTFSADAVFESLECWDSTFADGCTVTDGTSLLVGCVCEGLTLTEDGGLLTARETDFLQRLTYSTLDANGCRFRGAEGEAVSGGDAVIQSSLCELLLTSTGALQLYDSVFTQTGETAANVSSVSGVVRNCAFGGNLVVGTELQIDIASYLPQSVTAGTLVLLDRIVPVALGGEVVLNPAEPNTLAGVPFVVSTPFVAGAGIAEDLQITSGFPFAVEYVDGFIDVTTIGSASGIVRTATGGGGIALTSSMVTTALATVRSGNNAAGANAQIAAGQPLFFRRTNNTSAGVVFLWFRRSL